MPPANLSYHWLFPSQRRSVQSSRRASLLCGRARISRGRWRSDPDRRTPVLTRSVACISKPQGEPGRLGNLSRAAYSGHKPQLEFRAHSASSALPSARKGPQNTSATSVCLQHSQLMPEAEVSIRWQPLDPNWIGRSPCAALTAKRFMPRHSRTLHQQGRRVSPFSANYTIPRG